MVEKLQLEEGKGQDSLEKKTQQIPKPDDQVIDEDDDGANDYDPTAHVRQLEERIAEQQIQNRRLLSAIDGLKTPKEDSIPQPRPRDIEGERVKFYQDPLGTLHHELESRDNKILTQMKEMLAPMREVADNFKFSSEYDRLKSYLKTDPLFGRALKDPDIEASVDAAMKSGQFKVDEETVKSAISQIYGMKQMGGLGKSRSSDLNTRSVDPPHIQPTRTRIDSSGDKLPELTEDDRTAMKVARLNPDNDDHVKEYFNLINDETMVLKVHKDKKEGK